VIQVTRDLKSEASLSISLSRRCLFKAILIDGTIKYFSIRGHESSVFFLIITSKSVLSSVPINDNDRCSTGGHRQ
jgi:hypothetical protein